MRDILRQTVAVAVALGFALSGVAPAAGNWQTAVEPVTRILDRTQIDPAALALTTCDAGASAVAALVERRVATQVYAGLLKGPVGTLSAGAGNAWDQAALLQMMLESCGVETRFAFAQLSDVGAARLVAASARPVRGPAAAKADLDDAGRDLQAAGLSDEGADALRRIVTSPITVPELPAVVDKAAGRLDGALGATAFAKDPLQARMLAEAARYVWVQSRVPGEEEWTDHHVAYAPIDVPLPSRVDTSLPAEARHKAVLDVSLSITDGKELPLASTTLDMTGRAGISLAIIPETAGRDGLGDLASARDFVLRLEGAEQMGFSLDGEVFDPRKRTGPNRAAAGIGSALGGLNSTIGAIGGKSAPKLKPETDSVRLTLTLSAPFSAQQITIERVLWSRGGVGPAGFWTVMSHAGGVSEAEILDSLAQAVAQRIEEDVPTLHSQAGLAILGHVFDLAARSAEGETGLVWRAAPFVSIGALVATANDRFGLSFDILRSDLRAMERADGMWQPAPRMALRAGMAETLFETATTAAPPPATESRDSSAWSVLSEAKTLAVVRDLEQLRRLRLPEAVRTHAAADFERTGLIAVAEGGDPAWWRIDPMTGATTGVDSQGRGGAFIENIIVWDAALTIGFTLKSIWSCGGPDMGPDSDNYCAVKAFAWGILGFGASFAIGKALVYEHFVLTGRGGSEIVDLGVFMGSHFLNLISFNPL